MRNPWETGTKYYGIAVADCCVQDRLTRIQRMDAAQLRACLDWPSTQKTVRRAIASRLRKLEKEKA